ncbi:MAG: hypothetical protein ACI4A3_00710 [Lachnospiraceae bacterium]
MKRKLKVIIITIIILLLFCSSIVYIYFYNHIHDDTSEEYYNAGYVTEPGTGRVLPYCPDIPLQNQQNENNAIEQSRPEISYAKNKRGNNIKIKIKYDSPSKQSNVYLYVVRYATNEAMKDAAYEYGSPEDGNKVVLHGLEKGETYYIQAKCDMGLASTKWSKIKKVKVKK